MTYEADSGVNSVLDELEARIASHAHALDEFRSELRQIRGDSGASLPLGRDDHHESQAEVEDENPDRRRFLRRALAAAAGATVIGALGSETPLSAANGDALLVGSARTGTLPTELENTDPGSSSSVSAFKITGPSGRAGVWGIANGAAGAGILGESNQGYGLFGSSTSGYGVFAGGNGRIGTSAHLVGPGHPTTGSYALGDIVRNSVGTLYCCVEAGTPGLWREVAGKDSVGSLHFISPERVANTFDGTGMSIGTVPLNGQKTVTIASVVIESTALAVIGNVTAYSPSAFSSGYVSSGYLSVNAFGAGTAGVANTFQANTMFNGSLFVSKLTSGNLLQVNSFGTASHVTIDILGYWS